MVHHNEQIYVAWVDDRDGTPQIQMARAAVDALRE
jgi:hypothetical protein